MSHTIESIRVKDNVQYTIYNKKIYEICTSH